MLAQDGHNQITYGAILHFRRARQFGLERRVNAHVQNRPLGWRLHFCWHEQHNSTCSVIRSMNLARREPIFNAAPTAQQRARAGLPHESQVLFMPPNPAGLDPEQRRSFVNLQPFVGLGILTLGSIDRAKLRAFDDGHSCGCLRPDRGQRIKWQPIKALRRARDRIERRNSGQIFRRGAHSLFDDHPIPYH